MHSHTHTHRREERKSCENSCYIFSDIICVCERRRNKSQGKSRGRQETECSCARREPHSIIFPSLVSPHESRRRPLLYFYTVHPHTARDQFINCLSPQRRESERSRSVCSFSFRGTRRSGKEGKRTRSAHDTKGDPAYLTHLLAPSRGDERHAYPGRYLTLLNGAESCHRKLTAAVLLLCVCACDRAFFTQITRNISVQTGDPVKYHTTTHILYQFVKR